MRIIGAILEEVAEDDRSLPRIAEHLQMLLEREPSDRRAMLFQEGFARLGQRATGAFERPDG